MNDIGTIVAAGSEDLAGDQLPARALLRRLHEAHRRGGWPDVQAILESVFQCHRDALRAGAARELSRAPRPGWTPERVLAEVRVRVERAVKAWDLPEGVSVTRMLLQMLERVLTGIDSIATPVPAVDPGSAGAPPVVPAAPGANPTRSCARRSRRRRWTGLL